MKRNLILATSPLLLIFSCASIETQDENNTTSSIIKIDENEKFLNYLNDDWQKTLDDNPLFASYTGDKRQNNKISSNSIENFEKSKKSDERSLEKLKSIDESKLSEDNKLNYKLKEFDLLNSIQTKEFRYTQPKLVTKGVIAQLESIINSEIQSNPYMKVFIEADENLLTEDEKAELINSAERLIENKINPAYKRLYDFLKDDYLINSRDSIGIKDIPNGKEYYEFLARFYTTTDLTPEEIHNIGLQEIQRIRSEMEEIIRQVNWDGDFGSFLNYLRTSPRFYYDNGEDLFNAYLIMSKTIDPLLPKIFKEFPRAPYGVKPIPAESAPFTTTAYYNSPSPGRPGYFYANLYKPESRPKYEIPVLTVHEAVPGHHFQISIAQELENVPTFRKYQGITAFVEGWGLYSEELGEYINIYDDPYDKFGQLTYDMWRAIRLVVDTGMHYFDWSRQDAINLFLENSAKSQLDIENEVDRYIAWPGQALAYKIGQLKILELRNKSEELLGDKYDIKDFHYEVLKRGSLPLDLLEFYIDKWIEESINS